MQLPRLASLPALVLATTVLGGGAFAHPHAWITMRSDVIFDASGHISGLNIEWTFDADYSAAAIEGLDTNGDGYYSAGELLPLAKENIVALKEYDYFVNAKAKGKKLGYGEVADYGQVHNDSILKMYFTLPFDRPVDPLKEEFTYQIYDPTFYIAIDYAGSDAVTAVGNAPAGCKVELRPAPSDSQTDATRQMLAEKDKNWQPAEEEDFGSLFAQPVAVVCGKKVS